MKKIIFIWFVSFITAVAIAVFQRSTGPTYPIKGKYEDFKKSFEYKFPRSCTIGEEKCVGKIYSKDVNGYVLYKRYRVNEDFKKIYFSNEDDKTVFKLETYFPKAAKIEYDVYVETNNGSFKINDRKIILRLKGSVPSFFLISHIVLMFLFMIFSTYIFIENNFADTINKKIFYLNYLFLITGGFILGPIVQYYAFGVFWSGFPFGYDLTDNKVLVILIFWSITLFYVFKSKPYKKLINTSFIFTMIIYLIPHSLLGSEYDFSKGKLTNVKD